MLSSISILLLLLMQCSWLWADKCNVHLHSLADRQSHFVQCSTLHSVPVKLCDGCANEYNEALSAYKLIYEECTETYFNKDRINIVATMQTILSGLWNKAYCDNCLKDNTSDIFSEKSTDLNQCFGTNKGNECIKCLESYEDLNGFYRQLDQDNNGKVCYDMQDAMNRTRSQWSGEFKCCKRQFNITLFVIASASLGILPILFYGGLFMWTRRLERNHGLLNEEPEYNIGTPEVPTMISQPETSRRRAPSPPKKTIPIVADDSGSPDESDDDVATAKR